MSDLQYVSRGFTAGALEFQFRCDSEQTVRTYESIFRDLRACDAPAVDIEASHKHRHAFVRRPGGTPAGVPREHLVPWEVLRQVNLAALDADPKRIHVHGAALVLEGRGTLIVAPSGTGKTTTAALLTQLGAVYATDEMVGFSEVENFRGVTFPKPLSIKEDHHPAVSALAGRGHQSQIGLRSLSIVPASLVGQTSDTPFDIDLIVFLQRYGENRSTYSDVSPANATAELVLQAMDVERSGLAGLSAFATIVSRAACVAVSAGTPMDTAILVQSLATSLARPAPRSTPVTVAEPESLIDWIDFGDSVTFHARRSGQVGSFSGSSAQEWRKAPRRGQALLHKLLDSVT